MKDALPNLPNFAKLDKIVLQNLIILFGTILAVTYSRLLILVPVKNISMSLIH